VSARKEWIKLISRLINYNSTDDSNNNGDDDDDDDASTRDDSIFQPPNITRTSDINPLNNSISSTVELQINRTAKHIMRIENEI